MVPELRPDRLQEDIDETDSHRGEGNLHLQGDEIVLPLRL